MFLQCFKYLIKAAIKDFFNIVPAFVDAVVRDSALREIIGPDFFASIPRSYLGFSLFSEREFLFFFFDLRKFCGKDA